MHSPEITRHLAVPHQRIYLDNAATSWPKPAEVYAAIDHYLRHIGAAVARGGYHEAIEASRIVSQARRAATQLIGATDPNHIIFTVNATDALNLAIHGILKPGDHAICTDAEHNSVLRPLSHCREHLGVELTHIPCDANGLIDPDDIRHALRPNTRLVAALHASNVTGAIQPAAEIGMLCRDHGALFLLDAAQTLGHLPLSAEAIQADLIAFPGHKGLLGPLGTGLLYIRPGVERRLHSVRQGGTGSHSESDLQPDTLPDKYESGNLNLPGIAGLAASLAWLTERQIRSLREHEIALTAQLRTGLTQVNRLHVHGPNEASASVGVVSVSIEGYDPQEVALALDSAFHVQVRAGLHCAPRIHRAIGSFDRGGTVRFSIGPFTTPEEIDATIAAMAEIV